MGLALANGEALSVLQSGWQRKMCSRGGFKMSYAAPGAGQG